jgi:ribosomal protein L29
MSNISLDKPYDENSEKDITKLTPQEFRKELKRKKDELINFQPPKPTRQTRAKTSSKVAKNVSGWRRGFF